MHYNRPNYYPTDQALKYYEKLTFVDLSTEKRIGFTIGTFVQPCLALQREFESAPGSLKRQTLTTVIDPSAKTDAPLAKIVAIFIHTVSNCCWVFVLAEAYDFVDWKDSINDFRLVYPARYRFLLGIPAISGHRPYVVPIPTSKIPELATEGHILVL